MIVLISKKQQQQNSSCPTISLMQNFTLRVKFREFSQVIIRLLKLQKQVLIQNLVMLLKFFKYDEIIAIEMTTIKLVVGVLYLHDIVFTKWSCKLTI